MLILGIDTSCDETALAIVKAEKSKFEILSNVISSQVKLHQKYGGVYPFLAKREHQRNLPVVFDKTVKKAGIEIFQIDLIAVTNGPGLEPCLWQGINFARDLAEKFNKPLIPINHIEAHMIANFIEKSPKLPALCLVVSGGHTGLILMEKIGRYKLIGETLDDAAGECLDKTARILGLGYPGGPAISACAAKLKTINPELKTDLPRPMMYQKNYNFSFSGLKTAVLYKVKVQETMSKGYVQQMCAEIQQAIIDVLVCKTLKAARDYSVKTVLLGGGVAANKELRKQLGEKLAGESLAFMVPSKNFCTDNGVMVAVSAYFHRRDRDVSFKNIKAQGNLAI